MIASCDADGIVKMWDVRMVKGRFIFIYKLGRNLILVLILQIQLLWIKVG